MRTVMRSVFRSEQVNTKKLPTPDLRIAGTGIKVFPRINKAVLCGALLMSAFLSSAALQAELDPRMDNAMPSLAPMLETVTPAVVNISVTRMQQLPEQLRFFGGPQLRNPQSRGPGDQPPMRQSRGAGSGVVVNGAEGFIVTNHHVVDGADSISVGLQDGRVFEATLIGSDQRTDIALLQIDADRLTDLPLADADALRVGDYVVAIGNPFGLGQTVTSGIISALGRAGLNNENYEDFIQTDAAINVGNSGGALVDLRGRLVGINTAIISGSGTNSGVGFAVPVDMVEVVMGRLQRDGEMQRGQLGVFISDHTPVFEETLHLGADRGALVTQVFPGSAADRAGLRTSDLVVAVDNKPVRTSRDLRNAIGLADLDKDLRLDVLREGEPITISAHLEGSGQQQAGGSGGTASNERRADESRFFGAQLQSLPGRQQGVAVAGVEPQSRAAAAGLRAGDVIRALNRQNVASLSELNALLSQEPRILALTVEREGQTLLLIMP
ncbi:MAG: Do family serine endopeptidase [Pseudohongiella sp.]|nr:Do family serine endopeptidase [Pseudohongiella sp.]